jgi:hypothetical protein
MRVVADTNILVSYVLVPAGNPARILRARAEGKIELLLSQPILAECSRVLKYRRIRARHQLSDEEIESTIEDIRELATFVEASEVKIGVVKDDPSDNMIIECAVAGGADYIVSGDDHLLDLRQYEGIQILSPAEFLLLLNQHEQASPS